MEWRCCIVIVCLVICFFETARQRSAPFFLLEGVLSEVVVDTAFAWKKKHASQNKKKT